MKPENKQYKKIFDDLIKLWFSTDNASKWCCYYDLWNDESIRYFSNDLWLMHYSGDLWIPMTIKEVKELIRL